MASSFLSMWPSPFFLDLLHQHAFHKIVMPYGLKNMSSYLVMPFFLACLYLLFAGPAHRELVFFAMQLFALFSLSSDWSGLQP